MSAVMIRVNGKLALTVIALHGYESAQPPNHYNTKTRLLLYTPKDARQLVCIWHQPSPLGNADAFGARYLLLSHDNPQDSIR